MAKKRLNKNAKAWIAALRSGKFRQATQHLGYRGAYCCLGVACELAAKAGVIPARVIENKVYAYGTDEEGRETGTLPQSVQDWLGLNDASGSYQDKDGKNLDLTVLNDEGVKFKEIADVIESRPQGLFA
jgi:hypothetical protein